MTRYGTNRLNLKYRRSQGKRPLRACAPPYNHAALVWQLFACLSCLVASRTALAPG